MSKKKSKVPSNTIAQNKKARHDFHLEEKFEAGISLHGWEVKSLREGKVQIVDTYVFLKNGEAWLLNAQITPLNTVSTHFIPSPNRDRKLLLHTKGNSQTACRHQSGRQNLCLYRTLLEKPSGQSCTPYRHG